MGDKENLSYVRKGMTKTGISLGTAGRWCESQLIQDFQGIVAEYREYFEGKPVK